MRETRTPAGRVGDRRLGMMVNPKPETRNPAPPAADDVHIHIERLIVDGPPLDSHGLAQFQAALEAKLTRTLATVPSGSWISRSVARLSSAPVPLTPDASPAAWGRQAARLLFASLSAEAVTSHLSAVTCGRSHSPDRGSPNVPPAPVLNNTKPQAKAPL